MTSLRSRNPARVAASVVGVLLLAGCGPGGTTPKAVAIGMAQLYPDSSYQVSHLEGTQLAVTRLNALAQGRYVFETRFLDSARDDAAWTIAQLRRDPEVVGIVGPQMSQDVLEAAPELDRDGRGKLAPVAAIAPVGTNPSLSGLSPWVFRLAPSDSQLAIAGARFALDSLRARRALVLYHNDAFGRDWARMFGDAFQRSGGQLLASDRAIFVDETWWNTYIAQAKRLRPDVIVVPATDNREYGWVWRLRNAGITTPILFGDGGAELRDNTDHFPSLFYVGFYDPDRPSSAAATAFITEYQERFGRTPGQVASHAYDATMAIGLAVLAVGPDRRLVREYLAQARHDAIEGAAGLLAFDDRHGRLGDHVLLSRIP